MLMTKTEICANWPAALESVEEGSMLSGAIDFGFTKAALKELLALHKAGKYQDKIEELLVECNFISFCYCLMQENYDEAMEMEGLSEAD